MEIIKRSVINFLVLVTFVSIGATVLMLNGNTDTNNGQNTAPLPGTLARVLADHDCAAPVRGEFPTGVIVYKIGGGYSFKSNPKVVGKALDAAIDGKAWHGFEVTKFCR